jgi:hypothetical protein
MNPDAAPALQRPTTPATALSEGLEALRAQGAPRIDPVRFRHIEALQRRAAAHQGETRRLLDARLARLMSTCAQAVAQASTTKPNLRNQAPNRSALAELLAYLAGPTADAGQRTQHPHAPNELKTVRYFRSTWSRLRVDQQMVQALAGVPDQAGPLNTQRLLHQALSLMRQASPDYTQRFMAQVEALLWLEQAGEMATLARKGQSAPVVKKGPARGTRRR